MSFIKELWAFMRARKKYWLLPIVVMMVLLGVFDRPGAGKCRGALHLYVVLTSPHGYPRHIRLLSRQRRRPAA
jgi:hypothetical protein